MFTMKLMKGSDGSHGGHRHGLGQGQGQGRGEGRLLRCSFTTATYFISHDITYLMLSFIAL